MFLETCPFLSCSVCWHIIVYSILSWFFFKIYLFIYFWLCWVFVSVRGLSLVVASRGHSSSRCTGLSLSRPLLLWSTCSRRAGSVVVAHGPSCSVACGIFPDQGSNPCPLYWQADSQPLRHQGSPLMIFWMSVISVISPLLFLILFIWILPLFFLVNLARGLSIFFRFQRPALGFTDFLILLFFNLYFLSDLYYFFPSADFRFCFFFY